MPPLAPDATALVYRDTNFDTVIAGMCTQPAGDFDDRTVSREDVPITDVQIAGGRQG